MGTHLIMVSSITYAIKGRDLLRSHGYKAYIEKTPSKLDTHGCGYSIVVYTDPAAVLGILKDAGVKILGTAEREQL